MTLRQLLVEKSVNWLVNWIFKVYRQSVGDIDDKDYLSQSQIETTKKIVGKEPTCPYVIREEATAFSALNNMVYELGRDNPKIKTYWDNLSEKGLSRILNEVENTANNMLGIRIQAYEVGRDLKAGL